MGNGTEAALDAAQKALYAALNQAQAAVHGLAKDDRNAFANYDYTSAETIVACTKQFMTPFGLVLVPEEATVDMTTNPPILKNLRRLAHIEGGCICMTQDWPIVEGKGKPLDKATGTSATTSLGYFIRDLLLIPRGKDVDSMDARDDSDHNPQERPAGAPQAPSPAPKPKPTNGATTELIAQLTTAGQGQPPEWMGKPISFGIPGPNKESWTVPIEGGDGATRKVTFLDAMPERNDAEGKNRVAAWCNTVIRACREEIADKGQDPDDLSLYNKYHLMAATTMAWRSWLKPKDEVVS